MSDLILSRGSRCTAGTMDVDTCLGFGILFIGCGGVYLSTYRFWCMYSAARAGEMSAIGIGCNCF